MQLALSQTLPSLPLHAGVAVIRPRSLGDIILTTPALHALKAWRPDLRLACVVEDRFAAVLENNPDLDAVLALRRRVPRDTSGESAGFWRTCQRLRRFSPQVVVNLHAGNQATGLSLLAGARWRSGFAQGRNAWALNRGTPPLPPGPGRDYPHAAEHAASLFYSLGLPVTELGPSRVYAGAPARARIQARLRACGGGPWLFLHAHARESAMRWPASHMAELIGGLFQSYGWQTVMAREKGAPRPSVEEAIVERVEMLLPRKNAAIFFPETACADLIALMDECVLAWGNDGGPLHLAAALGKPVLAIFGPTHPEIWHPWRTSHRLLRPENSGGISTIQPDAVRQGLHALMPREQLPYRVPDSSD